MAANVTNTTKIKLTRGRPTQLGTVTNQNDAVQFTISEPTRDHQGVLAFQFVGGTTPTAKMEFSLDGGNTFTDIAFTAVATADFGDTAATQAGPVTVSGLGGATFRLGRTDTLGGAATVWALVG